MQGKTTEKMQDFAGRLKFFRTQRGLSQAQLGKLVGKGATTVSTWERGESKPDVEEIAVVASHLGVSPARLAYGDIDQAPTAKLLEGDSADYRKSGSLGNSPMAKAGERTPPMMLDPRFQPRAEPTPKMCLEYFQEFLARAEHEPGGVGFTWRLLHKHFPLDEFEPKQKAPS